MSKAAREAAYDIHLANPCTLVDGDIDPACPGVEGFAAIIQSAIDSETARLRSIIAQLDPQNEEVQL